MRNNIMIRASLGLGACLLAAAPGLSQTRTASALPAPSRGEDTATASVPSPEMEKRVREQIAGALPEWDKRLLTSYETGSPWQDNLNHRYLNKLLGETPFEWEGRAEPPPEADRLVDASKSMRIRRDEGVFRYQSRKRVFTPDQKGKAPISPELVSRQVEGLLSDLRFPLAEAEKGDVEIQEVSLSDEGGKVAERFPVYSFYTMQRRIDGVPVEGSTVRAAVNLRGEVQRLKIAWPHFKVRPRAELLSRERVIEEAVQKVLAQDPTEKLELASRIVYAKTEKGDFLPAVQVDVSDGETPYRLTLPVAR